MATDHSMSPINHSLRSDGRALCGASGGRADDWCRITCRRCWCIANKVLLRIDVSLVDDYVSAHQIHIVPRGFVVDRHGRQVTTGGKWMLGWLMVRWGIIEMGEEPHVAHIELPPLVRHPTRIEYKPRSFKLAPLPNALPMIRPVLIQRRARLAEAA